MAPKTKGNEIDWPIETPGCSMPGGLAEYSGKIPAALLFFDVASVT